MIVVLIEVDNQLSCHIQPDVKRPESKGSFDKLNIAKFYAMFLAL